MTKIWGAFMLLQAITTTSFRLSTRTVSRSHLRMSSSSLTTKPPPRNIVVIGGGIQGASVAYHLSQHPNFSNPSSTITILESKAIAAAASGKGGGFMARSWGDGGPTQTLHHLAFDLYPTLAATLNCETYRTLPVLSVAPGSNNKALARFGKDNEGLLPDWLDGNTGRIGVMGYGEDTAQVTPIEFTTKLAEASGATVVLGSAVGVNCDGDTVTGVRYQPRGDDTDTTEGQVLECTDVILSAGPWSCIAEEWFEGTTFPMEGVKSTSIVWKNPDPSSIPTPRALFCGEDDRFQTHLEVYPRPDGSIYLCGIGGSDYIPTEELKRGAYREVCEAKPERVEAASLAFKEMSVVYREGGELEKSQACMRPCPPDAMPYMGKIPGYEGAYINAGHNCWGIAWAPACGKAMAELVLDGHSSSVDLSPFDPARFHRRAKGGRGRKKGGDSVGEQW